MNLRDSLTSANELPAALKVGSLALGFLLSYIAPVQSFLIAVAVLVCADVVTGASACTIQVRAVRGGSANNITIRQGSSIVAHKVS